MQGRYGIDHFSRFLLVGALVCILLSGLLRASALNYVSWILLIWMYYRMFSKNIRKRCEEERMYMDTKEKVVRFCKGDKSVISDSKTHKIYRCPHCRQKIRVPRGKGKIEITCPSCRSKFIKRTWFLQFLHEFAKNCRKCACASQKKVLYLETYQKYFVRLLYQYLWIEKAAGKASGG